MHLKNSFLLKMSVMFLLALSGAASPALARTDLARYVPDETLLYLQITDAARFRKEWNASPYARMWGNPTFDGFFSPLKSMIASRVSDFEKRASLSIEELKEVFSGQTAVFQSDFIFKADPATGYYMEINNGFIAEMQGGSTRIRDLIEKRFLGNLPRDAERYTDEFRGVTIYTTIFWQPREGEPPTRDPNRPPVPREGEVQYHYEYAFVDDLCILLEGQRAYMKKILGNYFAVKEGREAPGSLAASDNFQRAAKLLPAQPDILGYVNIERFLNQASGYPPLMFFNHPALRLPEARSAAAGIRFTPRGIETDFVFCTVPSPTGLARLLIHEGRNDFRAQGMIPADALFYADLPLDLREIYAFLCRSFPPRPAPYPPSFQESIRALSEMAQVDVEKDLIGNLGSGIALFARSKTESRPESALSEISPMILVRIASESGFAENLAKTLDAAMPKGRIAFKWEPAEFRGFRIYSLKIDADTGAPGLPAPPSAHFTVANSFLILASDDDELKGMLMSLRETESRKLADREDFRQRVRVFNPDFSGLLWYDAGKALTDSLRPSGTPSFLSRIAGPLLDLGVAPPARDFAPYVGSFLAAFYIYRDAWHARGLLDYPEAFSSR